MVHISSRGYGIIHDLMHEHLEKLQNYAHGQWLLNSIALFYIYVYLYFVNFVTHFCTYIPYPYGRGNELLTLTLKMASFTTNSYHRVLWTAFIDQGGFEAMKVLSGWEIARGDEHPFRAKIKVSA